jgi:hypothetical protein
MAPLVSRSRLACRVLIRLLVLSACSVSAQDEPEGKQRPELMQTGSFKIESAELKAKAAITFAAKPLLRYSDPTRGGVGDVRASFLSDAVGWRLGTEGRPTALVTSRFIRCPTGRASCRSSSSRSPNRNSRSSTRPRTFIGIQRPPRSTQRNCPTPPSRPV